MLRAASVAQRRKCPNRIGLPQPLGEAWASDHNGANLWADKTVKFLDPCTKSGVLLCGKNFFEAFAAFCSKFLRSLLFLSAGPTPNSEEPQFLTVLESG